MDSEIRAWLTHPLILNENKKQNNRHRSLSQEDIQQLDSQWRNETIAVHRPLIDSLLARPSSQVLLDIKQRSRGLFTEIFVVDMNSP